jgi:DNA-binding transcriptional LysR family regulator
MIDFAANCQTFVRVVEAGSFSAVALERNTSQPTISRQIAALEQHLGCLLFQRTTRRLSLTDDGKVFYSQALRLIDAVQEAESSVGAQRAKPSGVLRLGCAVVFGRLHLIPRLGRFMQRYPEISVDLEMNDGFSDLVEDSLDLVLRVGTVTEPNLVARRIGSTYRVVVATPGYVKRYGKPKTPADLANHCCVIYSRLAGGANWSFEHDGRVITVPIQGKIHVSSTEGVRAAILAGLGVGYVPVWHFVDDEIGNRRLVRLLPNYQPVPQPISAVYRSRRFLSPRVRAMIDFLAEEFNEDPDLRIQDNRWAP